MKKLLLICIGIAISALMLEAAKPFYTPVFKTKAPLKASGHFNYQFGAEVETGENAMPLLGQLDKDGSDLILAMQDAGFNNYLYTMKRGSGDQPFELPEKLQGELNDPGQNTIMPTVTADKEQIIFVKSADGTFWGNDLYLAQKDEEGNFNDIRALDEINDPDLSESYPWISPDGKRLYFARQIDLEVKFFVAERENSTAEFGTPEELAIELPPASNNMSCFLTNDESEIYILSGTKIFHALRNGSSGKFSRLMEIAETGNDGYINGLTMSPDKSEMLVFVSKGFRDIRLFQYLEKETNNNQDLLNSEGGFIGN